MPQTIVRPFERLKVASVQNVAPLRCPNMVKRYRTWKKAPPRLLSVQVVVKQTADFVKIEVPIPAGCDYYSKTQQWNGVEDHREYFKDRTVIFCSSLPVGNYTFEIVLEPRFNGVYTMNPAKVEQLYFPVFYGNNEGKGVEVQ